MLSISRQMVRVAVFVLLFQFVCPAFLNIVVQQIPTSRETAFTVQHTSIVIPMLLKEKDEKENAEFLTTTDSAPLLDLTSHSSNLTAAHNYKNSEVAEEHDVIHPELFKVFCSFII